MPNSGPPLTPWKSKRQIPLTERVDRFWHRHPEIRITSPDNATGKWEVSEPDKAATAYDNGLIMMDDLEKRYPE